jgi:hypothetical protein
MSICYPRRLLCPAVPRLSSSLVVGWGRKAQWVEETPSPLVPAQDPPFNRPLGGSLSLLGVYRSSVQTFDLLP